MLDRDEILKITDFGFSTFLKGAGVADSQRGQTLLQTKCGTPHFMAPEVADNII